MTTEDKRPEVDALESVWSSHAGAVRAFVQQRPNYECLGDEVAYILHKKLKGNGIEVAAVTSRAKSVESFCEKITRKACEEPLTDITDLAGVRVVYLYKDDRSVIENIVEREFNIIEKVDKTEEKESDQFGYEALHYLVNIGKGSTGARYDDLKKLVCEIQVRTVLQDAWAIVSHHLSYKQESDVPKPLRRKLNSLSGMFETADDQFEKLRTERQAYVKKALEPQSRRQPLDLDVLRGYLHTKFPDKAQPSAESTERLLTDLRKYGYTTLSSLDDALIEGEKTHLINEPLGLILSAVGIVRRLLHAVDTRFPYSVIRRIT